MGDDDPLVTRHTRGVDQFSILVEDSDEATSHFWPKAAVVYVNGVRLFDLAYAATSEPDEEWVSPPPRVVLPPSRQLLGGADVWEDPGEPYFDDGLVAVGACGCSYPGCDALLVKIDVLDEVVVWHDFRRHNRPSALYPGLGPFRFDRREYEAALAAAAGAKE